MGCLGDFIGMSLVVIILSILGYFVLMAEENPWYAVPFFAFLIAIVVVLTKLTNKSKGDK